jgi:hypothetical protein
MRNKRESGLVLAMQVNSDDLPRIGETVILRGARKENGSDEIGVEAVVYNIFRNIYRYSADGTYTTRDKPGNYA